MEKLSLYLYGQLEGYSVIDSVLSAESLVSTDSTKAHQLVESAVRTVLGVAQQYGYCGNLWQCFVTGLLIEDENPYTLSLEMKSSGDSPATAVASADLKKLFGAFNYDFTTLENSLGEQVFSCFTNTDFADPKFGGKQEIGRVVSALAGELASAVSVEQFTSTLENFYRTRGVGAFAFAKAFRLQGDSHTATILPIYDTKPVEFSDLWGYEYQKEQVIDNTSAFVSGKQANNVLLYGDAGTGKSTMIKAVLNEYAPQGLRMIEVYKHQFGLLTDLIAQLKCRNYKFAIYMDDLSFEDFETEYKYLKAVIEGGLEERPSNILVYATSNRRHLVKETWKDRADMDAELHKSDTMSEKLSLADRFGVSIGFFKPNQKDFFAIVEHLADKHGVTLSKEELLAGARQWELSHSGRSGRSAQQYINYVLSK